MTQALAFRQSASIAPADFQIEVQEYMSALFRYCQRLTGSQWEAEDLVQDTLLRALPKLASQHDNPHAYLFRIAKNAWIDKCRKQKVAYKFLNHQQPAAVVIDSLLVHDAIIQLIQHLSPLQRSVVLLREVFQFSSLEVAGMLSTTEGAVRAALHRARKTLDAVRAREVDAATSVSQEVAEGEKELLNAYLLAFRNYDVQGIIALAQYDVIHPIQALQTLSSITAKGHKHSKDAKIQRSGLRADSAVPSRAA